MLVATNFNDNDFLNTITQNFDLDLINNDLAIFAKGIYFLYKNDNLKAVNLLWQSFNTNKHLYFNHQNFLSLICLFEDFKLSKERHILLQYLIKTFPYVIEYHMQYIIFLMQVRFNDDFTLTLAESNAIILQEIDYIYNHAETSFDWYFLAEYYFQFGYKEKFFECNNNAFLNMNSINNSDTNLLKKQNNFPAKMYLEFMNYLLDFLDKNNIKAFPDGGSLLGLYRDGKFMDYDKDADIGIIVNNNDEVLNIIKILSANEKFTFPNIKELDFSKQILNIGITNKQKDIAIDIFFYHKKDNFLYEEIATKLGNLCWKYSAFNLIKTKFNNKEYYVPDNIERYLVELFGDTWKEHISVWDSLINCPNITPESQLVVFYYGSIRMHQAFRQKKYAKALNYYTQLKNRWQYPFTPQMCENIENYLEKIKPQEQK